MRRTTGSMVIAGMLMVGTSRATPADHPSRDTSITSENVARLPHPGTVVPGAIGFTQDGKSVYFLKSEGQSLSRVLWRADVGKTPNARVIARPPGTGDTDATVSREEALRRERQRLRDTGITAFARAADVDLSVIPISGDLYLQKNEEPLVHLTSTTTPEIDPKPSPDGSRVAFVRSGELTVLDLATQVETGLTNGAVDGLTNGLAEFIAQEEFGRFTGYWWSPDGQKIAYEQVDERNLPQFTIAHQGDKEFSTETHRYPFSGAENATVRLGVVSVMGGATTWIPLAEANEDFYLARVDWEGPRSLLAQVLSRDQKSLKLYRVDVSSGERTLLIEERSPSYVNLHDELRILPETGEILWSSERTGFRHLELRDKNGGFLRPLTSGDWPVDSVVGLDPKRREVAFTSGRTTPLQSHLYRVSLDGGPIHQVTKERGTHRPVVASDGNHFVDVYSRIDLPPITTLRDREGKILAILDDASSDPRVAQLSLTPPRLTQFKNREGTTLYGAYYTPRNGQDNQRSPLVVMVYGGPHVQTVTDSWAMTADLTAQFLAERGFAVWKCDNRGSSRRGFAFESALFHKMGEVEVRDQVDGIRFVAASQPEADTSRVGITGGSYGGYMTLRCLLTAPDIFHAGVSIAPVTDWDGYDTGYTERYMGTPSDNAAGYASSSVLPLANRLTGDLLLIHGMLDENVHFRHSARFVSALIAAGRPFRFLPLPNERHSSRKIPERKYIAEQLDEFFSTSLKQSPSKHE